MKILKIKGGKTLLDNDDYEWVSQFHWRVNTWGYAQKSHISDSGKVTTIRLNRVILNAPIGMEVDHINRNKLDNRKKNLRLATKKQNIVNRPANSNNILGIKGVCWHKRVKKFQARIVDNRKHIHIGYYDSIKAAKAAYKKVATKLRGEFLCL